MFKLHRIDTFKETANGMEKIRTSFMWLELGSGEEREFYEWAGDAAPEVHTHPLMTVMDIEDISKICDASREYYNDYFEGRP